MGTLIRFTRKGKPQDGAARPLFPPFRSASQGTDAHPAKWFPSDASPIADDVPRAGRAADPDLDRKRRRRRHGAIAVLAFVFVGGIAAALFGDRGYLDVRRQQLRLRESSRGFDEHLMRVQALKQDVERLKRNPAAIERIAREELGYVAPNEITLLLPGEDSTQTHRLDGRTGSAIVPAVRSTP